MASAELYAHYRAEDTELPDGIYRVVGVSEDRVTLLRVGAVDGRRLNTGKLIELHRGELDNLHRAPNPDGNRPIGETLVRRATSVFWRTRTFVRTVIAHPLPAMAAGLILLLGFVGGRTGTIPEMLSDGLVLVGALALAAVGSGRVPHR